MRVPHASRQQLIGINQHVALHIRCLHPLTLKVSIFRSCLYPVTEYPSIGEGALPATKDLFNSLSLRQILAY
jgi:hypothetical protein